jgi:sorbitol/mannitol transport system substrate-binding protein
MPSVRLTVAFATALLGSTTFAQAETLTIATVNNADMIIMQKLSPRWEQATGHKLNWVVLEENVLRQRATTDIATKGGQFDIITIGSYEAPIWGKQNWLTPLNDLGDDYDYGDVIPSVKSGLSYDGKLYAVPFYAESSPTSQRSSMASVSGASPAGVRTWRSSAPWSMRSAGAGSTRSGSPNSPASRGRRRSATTSRT